MKRLPPLVLLMALAACNGESPTDPAAPAVRPTATAEFGDPVMIPPAIQLKPGETREVTVEAPWAYALGADFRSTSDAVATITGRIAPSSNTGIATITAHAAGRVELLVTIHNFGRPPGTRTIGTIIVAEGTLRRRSVGR